MSDLILILKGSHPVLSVLLWLTLANLVLYLARSQVHQTIRAVSRVVANAMRLAAYAVRMGKQRLDIRNKEVLLASGAEEVEREIEREFHRIEAVVRRDLQGYPTLHRNMSDLITRIDEDYRQSTETPPSPPAWIDAVETVIKLPDSGDMIVAGILSEVHKTINRQHKQTMTEFRRQSSARQGLLKKMAPYWRKLNHTVEDVGKTITGLHDRAALIDRKMADYEAIMADSDRMERRLFSSSLTQFFIAGLVLLIAIGGAVINFNLIALPMSEMVGGGSYIGPLKMSNVAAMVIILVEVVMGLFIMESLRITRLFPIIGMLDDKMRRRIIWTTFAILLTLASIESALAFMHDRIAADIESLRQTLAGGEAVQGRQSWIPTVGQMVLGFVLPFALTFVAIPLESFIHSARTVLGVFVAEVLRVIAIILRLVGNISLYLGNVVISFYDLLIFPLLWLNEKIFSGRRPKAKTSLIEEVKQ
jgi:hypothetical protein